MYNYIHKYIDKCDISNTLNDYASSFHEKFCDLIKELFGLKNVCKETF